MSSQEQTANGVIKSSKSMDQLLEIFIANGQTARMAESAHYKTGRCIRVKHGEARITIEMCDSCTYLIHGEAGQPLELDALCETTTKVLSSEKINHDIELYDDSALMYKKSFGDINNAPSA
ncbi:MAG: hypothetical protein IPK50_01425 [Fibrobacterota bacterium]|nr:MAG: hypothetical protein IPK50_01425 [Fibrobacterota bacterium]